MTPTISLCVTAYRETERGNCQWIRECVAPAVDAAIVREIVVVNDGTPDFQELAAALRGTPKVRLLNNAERLHVFGNKLESVWQATSDWCLMCDSDNIMGGDYYARLAELAPWNPQLWYCASFAKPNFDYRSMCGTWDVKGAVKLPTIGPNGIFWCLANTGNQFVHRGAFLEIFGKYRERRFDLMQPDYIGNGDRTSEERFTAYGANDSFFMFKEWLLSGRAVCCVPALEYSHRVETGNLSNYNRGPQLKERIPACYFLELVDAANGERHGYQFVRDDGPTVLLRDDGRLVSLNRTIGEISVT